MTALSLKLKKRIKVNSKATMIADNILKYYNLLSEAITVVRNDARS